MSSVYETLQECADVFDIDASVFDNRGNLLEVCIRHSLVYGDLLVEAVKQILAELAWETPIAYITVTNAWIFDPQAFVITKDKPRSYMLHCLKQNRQVYIGEKEMRRMKKMGVRVV